MRRLHISISVVRIHPDPAALANQHGYGVQRRVHAHGLSAGVFRARRGVHPVSPCGQIHVAHPCARFQHRGNQHIRAEEVLILHRPSGFIRREAVEQGTHDWVAVLVGGAHHLADVRAHPLTHEQVLPQNLVHLVAERPDFVALTACQLAHVADVLLLALIPRAAFAVHPEYRAEARPLEPAHQQLAERQVIHLTAEEAANVARPPRNACHAHAQTRLQLLPHRAEGGGNIARPSENGVFLAARPCAAHKRQNLRFARLAQSIVEALCVADGVGVCALQGRACVIAVVVKVIRPVFRLGLVQPEAADAILVVVLLALGVIM